MKNENNKPHIIIDNGSGYLKAGFNFEEGPRTVFPTCISYGKYPKGLLSEREFFVGYEAIFKRSVLKINYPIERGKVTNWDDMEKIWRFTLEKELEVDPVEHNVFLTEAILNPKEQREKMSQIMFETFQVPGLYITISSVLSLYNVGKLSGLVVDLGEGVSSTIAISDEKPLPYSINRLDFSGKDLTNYMMKLLNEKLNICSTTVEKEHYAEDIKKKTCYVALDFQKEHFSAETFDYKLPDDKHIYVRYERLEVPEILFKPNIFSKEDCGIGEMCVNSIRKCDFNINKNLYNNIVLSGGTSMFNGLPERFTKEIKALAPESIKEGIKVIALPERTFSNWIGGSIISSLSNFESNFITRAKYLEYGRYI